MKVRVITALLIVLSATTVKAKAIADVADNNGFDWSHFSFTERTTYLLGYLTATGWAEGALGDTRFRNQFDYEGITVGALRVQVDSFYRDGRNRPGRINAGLEYARDTLRGVYKSEDQVQAAEERLRRDHSSSSTGE